MDTTATAYREVAVPVSIFDALRRELSKEAGTLPTIHALHSAGFTAGSAAAVAFRTGDGSTGEDPAEDAFWAHFVSFFQRRGWGTLTHRTDHPAIGFLVSHDWVEAEDTSLTDDAACSFTSGFLSGLLSELAGGPVAVLEVTCRARGEGSCTFAFGSESAVHELYGQLVDDADLDRALSSL
ncbi:MAG: hypothetical protein PVJ02_15195 [Gemmatimonadota bacterium]|jgi:hypothetical protein